MISLPPTIAAAVLTGHGGWGKLEPCADIVRQPAAREGLSQTRAVGAVSHGERH